MQVVFIILEHVLECLCLYISAFYHTHGTIKFRHHNVRININIVIIK